MTCPMWSSIGGGGRLLRRTRTSPASSAGGCRDGLRVGGRSEVGAGGRWLGRCAGPPALCVRPLESSSDIPPRKGPKDLAPDPAGQARLPQASQALLLTQRVDASVQNGFRGELPRKGA